MMSTARVLLGFAVVGTSFLSGSFRHVEAQSAEEATTSESDLQEPALSSELAPEEPALQLKLDAAGVDVAPSPPRTVDGYTLEEMDVRVRRSGSAAPLLLSLLVGYSWRPELVVTAGGEGVPKERSATGVRTPARLW